MSTLIAGTYTGSLTKVASAILAGYSTPVANGSTLRSALFSNGENGVWFDPSDFSTMFQDNLGTTPVTAVGQTVGLMLDKSQGLSVSSVDALGGKGTFSTPADWSDAGAVSTITGGQLVFNGTAILGGKYSALTTILTVGKYYQITFDIISITKGGIRVWAGTSDPGVSKTTVGTHSYELMCTSDGRVRVYNDGTSTDAVVDNVVVKEVFGNHATQPTSTARPVLGRHPITGRRNLLNNSNIMNASPWTTAISGVVAPVITASADAPPIQAENVVWKVDFPAVSASQYSTLYSSTGVLSSATRVGTIYIKAATVGDVGKTIWIYRAGIVGKTAVTLTANWQRYSTSGGGAIADTGLYIAVLGSATGGADQAAVSVNLSAGQLELGSTPTNYQKVTSIYDTTEAGVNSVYELFGDGVDNRLTSATGGGGTTGILLCAAILPRATAAATLWSDAGTNTGYKMTLNATNNIILSAGNGIAYTSVTGPVLAVGTEYVVMAWHDGVNLNVQVNGGTITSTAFGTVTAGTAGFSVLADNGTAANWFNGTVASLIYRQNDTSTATDRANMLAYVNSKAGAF